MIGSLTGRLVEKSPAEILVEASGVGYRVSVPLTTYGKLPAAGETVTLSIHTHVREDAISLYGFGSRRERNLFERLIRVPGVGPRLGLALMSHLEPAEMLEAVRNRDAGVLGRVPGIGPKTAERLALELAGLASSLGAAAGEAPPGSPGLRSDLISALENLGYRNAQAAPVVDALLARPGARETGVAILLREA
ncbi:MAG TPA: Holliday junction branch migration protein RuvA, partial [Candidatus Saccharimonadales bacterium]|nr:Holliday junction branch migration protein RuvA [Candidatus Saccharimonadales bacterium]